MTHGKLQANGLDAKTILKGFIKLNLIIGLLLVMSGNLQAQIGNGSSSQESRDTSNNADQNLKSVARVNPSTLAMEFSLPLMSYPGRNGNSLPVGINYSSKIWRMESKMQWWYPLGYQTRYVTDIHTRFAEHSAAGWTSSLIPPRLKEKTEIYNEEGQPYNEMLLNEAGINNNWQTILDGFVSNNLEQAPCGTFCRLWDPIHEYPRTCIYFETSMCDTGGGGGGPGLPEPPEPTQLYYRKNIEITMSDGSTHEFRSGDSATHCGTSSTGCNTSNSMESTYLSVDGSGMKVVVDSESGTRTLYLSNGSKFEFPSGASPEGIYTSQYTDADGNVQSFSRTTSNNQTVNKWTDTLGREIIDPIPHNWLSQTQSAGPKDVNLPGLNNQDQQYKMKWLPLKPVGCEDSTDPNCGAGGANGALEDQTQKLYFETKYFCRGSISEDLSALSNGEVLFSRTINRNSPLQFI